MRPLTVMVTEWHIHQGQMGDCNRCPIALAVRDALVAARPGASPHAFNVRVNRSQVTFDIGSRRHAMTITAEMELFIRTFDNGRKVKPFHFLLQ